jgi:hypothetical protein
VDFDRIRKNKEHSVQKEGPSIGHQKLKFAIIFKTLLTIFDEVSVIWEDHLPKEKQHMHYLQKPQMRYISFAETGFIGRTNVIVVRYSTTNRGFRFEGDWSRSIAYEDVRAMILRGLYIEGWGTR